MAASEGLSEPVAGVYEKLITHDVQGELTRFSAAGWTAVDAEVTPQSAPMSWPATSVKPSANG